MTAKQIVKELLKDGFELKSQKGSHMKFKKGKLRVIVPNHGNKDLATGTVNSIRKQAGWK